MQGRLYRGGGKEEEGDGGGVVYCLVEYEVHFKRNECNGERSTIRGLMSQVLDVIKVMEEVAKVEMEEGGATKVVLPKCIIFQHQSSSWNISLTENPYS